VSEHIPDAPLDERLARAAQAAQALSDALWEALHDELAAGGPLARHSSERTVELSERLAGVAGAVALLAGSHPSTGSLGRTSLEGDMGEASRGEVEAPISGPRGAREPAGGRTLDVAIGEPARAREARSREAADGGEERGEEEAFTPAIIVDERASSEDDDEPASEGTRTSDDIPAIAIRDERSATTVSEGGRVGASEPAPWVASISRRLERYARDGLPFAVLLLELGDVERLRHAELPGEVARLTGLVEAALAAELRPADSLMRESPGRYWLLAPETDVAAAKQLASRLAAGVRSAASHHGAPLTLAVGIAVCPDDGRRAAALVARADIALYAAHAIGAPPPPPSE
jgi:GGDEF domain-containing protein